MTALLDELAPVGLGDLVERAALLTRVDRKYVLPAATLPVLLERLSGTARVLEIDGRRSFGYRSDYLDTPALDSYLGVAHRRRRRFKVRIRSYRDTGDRFAEVKTRGPRGVTVKHRVPYTGDADARAYARTVLGAAVVPCDTAALRRTLTTRYERSTLLLPASGSRLTVDTGLAWVLPGDVLPGGPGGPGGPDGPACALPDRVVVETKSARAAGPADRLLWSLGHRPRAVSKYATGLAALRPELPANRWLPVLRRHFRLEEL
ncbi:polyphosphate polymerase domain-containing protein [Dactylosporangium sp. NPDC005572]|uniref:polyphosphate polymerase domain-containing protein n=1 Tax=Dactylosporangium sp. NPDC005572 TaxID=3156889 RepID=UPI0033A51386